MKRSNPSCLPAYVPVGAAIPYAAVAALDELAQKRGLTRSAVLRAVIDRGLIETMASDPDLFARYLAIPPAPSRSRRRARQFSLALKQTAGGWRKQ
jgi:hypothetical protein